ncbi:TetR family transcriptional regulator [Curtobacterium sp. MCPF17_021]|uniref:TetR/AcrR family transcriptional regulator n=1 Tax=Curtobacterium sp. MCPF17_021 TaxID=2175639 RepID=UPI000DA86CBF|nr:TetR family transcriptional regulator [Curtobacterium sp. MCPF17_021]WIE84766.1 TetR/AcrR family transcriptional regulator [Curtobacterium sp. MCPF17_021]
MRESKRALILDAAARVVQREGIKSVTYETVAAEAGLTKGGLVYHFPSREDMITAVHEHLAAEWEASMVRAAGKTAEEATPTERMQGYARAATQSATRAELLFMLEGSTTDDHAVVWNAVLERWTAPPPVTTDDEHATNQFLARLAADGLWLFESLSDRPLAPELRRQLADLIADRLTAPGS